MPNIVTLTLTEKSGLTNPRFIFYFTPDFSHTSQQTPIPFTLTDISPFPRRYNLFQLEIGTASGQVDLPAGWGSYEVYEQSSSDPVNLGLTATTGRVLEKGRWWIDGIQNINFY